MSHLDYNGPRDITLLPGENVLPRDLVFEGLLVSQGTEVVRIRLRSENGRRLDLPASSNLLAALVRDLCLLDGAQEADMSKAVSDLRTAGKGTWLDL